MCEKLYSAITMKPTQDTRFILATQQFISCQKSFYIQQMKGDTPHTVGCGDTCLGLACLLMWQALTLIQFR